MLSRSDLPDDPDGGDRIVETRGWPVPDSFPGTGPRRSRLLTSLSRVAAVLLAVAMAVAVWVAAAVTGRSTGLTATAIIAVPLMLLVASLLASLAGRRRRR